jgi:signal transduction histidine kinase
MATVVADIGGLSMEPSSDIASRGPLPEITSIRRESFVDAGRIINGAAIAIALTVITYFFVSDRIEAAQPWRMAFLATLLLTALASYGLARAGRSKLGAGVLAVMLWLAVTAFSFGTGFGMHSATVFAYVPAILYAALMLGIGPAIVQSAFTIAALAAMYWLEESGRIGGVHAAMAGTTNFNFLLGVAGVCIATLVIAVVYQRGVDRTARRALREMSAQRRTLETLHRTRSDLEAAHAEVLALNTSLEQRVAERTRALEETLRDLESFSYSISHDLRAPLRAINGFAAILQREHAAGLNPEAARLLGRIGAATDRMDSLVSALLELVELGRRTPVKEDVDLSALASAIAEGLGPAPRGTTLEFRIAPGLRATGDRRLLQIVLENLLGNAVKYSSGAAAPLIEVGAEYDGERRVYFVRDNGAGFDVRHAAGLFKPFQRLHTEAEFEGIGIGLASVRLIVERHGGRVWADATPGGGAKFCFILP